MNQINKIAYNIYKQPKVYALFLGAGISYTARIPTAYQITEIIKKELKSLGENIETDNYSVLLDTLTETSSERMGLLNEYFEPNEEDREEDRKLPTEAHHAIAELVAAGYIKLIVTTNFDRLMEQALQARGIEPVVISNDNDFDKVKPLIHSNITIVKIHGDYQDITSLNTTAELAEYSPKKKNFLSRYVPEFGWVFCGWSASYDKALVELFKRYCSDRYAWYWLAPDGCSAEAEALLNTQSNKEMIRSMFADEFFTELAESVKALASLEYNNELDVKIAVRRVKKLLQDPNRYIDLEDLIVRQAERERDKIFNSPPELHNKENYIDEMLDYISNNYDISFHLIKTMLEYERSDYQHIFIRVLRCWMNDLNVSPIAWFNLKHNVLLLLYIVVIVSLDTDNWSYVDLFFKEKFVVGNDKFSPMERILNYDHALSEYDVPISMGQNDYYKVSNHNPYQIHIKYKEIMEKIFEDRFQPRREYIRIFRISEFIISLIIYKYNGSIYQTFSCEDTYTYAKAKTDIGEFLNSLRDKNKHPSLISELFNGNITLLLKRYQEAHPCFKNEKEQNNLLKLYGSGLNS